MARSESQALAAFRPVVLVSDEDFDRIVREASRTSCLGECIAFGSGALLGLWLGAYWLEVANTIWLRFYGPLSQSLMMGLLAWTIYDAVSSTRVVAKLHRQPLRIDIFWLAVGDSNPFDAPVMDIRAHALNVVATTRDKSIAENFVRSRKSNGREFIGMEPRSPVSLTTEIAYPHNGAELEGIVFKSPAMEVKWDIYAYGEWFYFVHSWTSDLADKVRYKNTGKSLVLTQIIAENQCTEETAQDIHSIILTHAFGRVWPFHVPEHMHDSDGKCIALHMFSQFGSKATSVTKENDMKIQLVKR